MICCPKVVAKRSQEGVLCIDVCQAAARRAKKRKPPSLIHQIFLTRVKWSN